MDTALVAAFSPFTNHAISARLLLTNIQEGFLLPKTPQRFRTPQVDTQTYRQENYYR